MSQTVYRFVPNAAEYDVVELTDGAANHAFDDFDGTPLASTWEPPTARLAPVGRRGDFPSLSWRVPVVSSRAWDVLASRLEAEVEALTLSVNGRPYFALNVLAADCLDVAESDVAWLPGGGINRIDRYAFRPGCLDERHMFKLPETPGEVLVTDSFRSIVEAEALNGLIFQSLERPARPAPAE